MKIVYATTVPLAEQSAPAHHVLASSRAFRELGHRVEAIYPGPPLNAPIRSRSFDSETVLFRPRFRGGARTMHLHLAIEILRRDWSKVDVLYLRLAPTRLLMRALDRVPVPKALEINGSEMFRLQLFPEFARKMDLILVDSEPLRRRCVEIADVPVEKVGVHLSPAFDTSDTHAYGISDARRELGIERSASVVLHVSGFQPHHDFHTIEGAIRVMSRRDDVACPKWILVGDGPTYHDQQMRFADLIEAGVVQMPGQVALERVMIYIAAADVCINVLTEEKLADGNLRAYKLYQYVGLGKPTIESVDEALELESWAQEALYLIPPGSPAALARAVSDILGDPGTWSARALRGRNHVTRHRTWTAAMKTTLMQLDALSSARVV